MIDTKYEVKIVIIVISSKDYFIFNFYILYRYFKSQARYRLGFHQEKIFLKIYFNVIENN